MRKNVGKLDSKIRYRIAIVLALIGLLGLFGLLKIGLIASIVLIVFAVISFLTARMKRCGIYGLVDMDTLEEGEKTDSK